MSDEALLEARARALAARHRDEDALGVPLDVMPVRIAGREVWLPATSVLSLRVAVVTPLPAPIGAVLGLVLVDGRPVSVVDVGRVLGLGAASDVRGRQTLLTLEQEGRRLAMPVEEAASVRTIDARQLEAAPDGAPDCVSALAADGSMFVDLHRLFTRPDLQVRPG